MAAKNTLKYKRNPVRPLLDLVNDLIDICVQTIQSPNFNPAIADLIKLISLRMKLKPFESPPSTARWLDRIEPTGNQPLFPG